jgi:porin
VTVHVEEGWLPKFGPGQLQGKYQAGLWSNTAGGDDVILGSNGLPYALTGLPPLHRSEQYGYYIQGLQQLTGTGTVAPGGWRGLEGLTVFFNFIQADRATAVQDNQVSIGVFYAAPFASRPNDHVGIGFARTDYNPRAAEAIGLAQPGAALPRAEYGNEIYYSGPVLPWLTVRPDLQYIRDPGGYRKQAAVVVVGARVVAIF